MTKEKEIQLVEKYRYWGCMLTADWEREIEVKTRIPMIKEAFDIKKNLPVY